MRVEVTALDLYHDIIQNVWQVHLLIVAVFGKGKGSQTEVVLEVVLSYWLSWFVLPSGPEDGLTTNCFP